MFNYTESKNQEAVRSLCSEAMNIQRLGEGQSNLFIHSPPFFLPVYAVMVSITTSANILILIAPLRGSSLHPSSRLLFRCLSTTDLCVGLISQPLFVIHLMMIASRNWSICRITEGLAYASSAALCGESISTLTAISVDRLLALLLGLRYREVVTLARVRLFVIISWITHLTFPLTYLWSEKIFFFWGSAWQLFCLSVSTFCYSKIYLNLFHRRAQIQDQSQGSDRVATGINVARYKKTVSSALWIHSILLICYLPYTVTSSVTASSGLSPSNTALTGLFVFFNSMLNPFLFFWKIRAFRQAVKQAIRRNLCC